MPRERVAVAFHRLVLVALSLQMGEIRREEGVKLCGHGSSFRGTHLTCGKLSLLGLKLSLGRDGLSSFGKPPVMVSRIPVHTTGTVYTMTCGIAVCSTD